MNDRSCLYCYQPLSTQEVDFHSKCSKRFFGTSSPPVIEYTNSQMLELAEKVVKAQSVVTGVQPKLSLGIHNLRGEDKPSKLTIVGALQGLYILKPPSSIYPFLPELESLTMHLAEIAKIATVPHSLIRLASGELAYITKRIDRGSKGRKIHMEDMCQVTEKLTEHKYRGSYEQINKAILKYTANPGFDSVSFFEQVICCFLTGNNDMHLKNFSIIDDPKKGYSLAPAYDMVAAALVVDGDDEELALSLSGRKKRINRQNINQASATMGIPEAALGNILRKFARAIPKWYGFIDSSFLDKEFKEKYKNLISSRAKQIEVIP